MMGEYPHPTHHLTPGQVVGKKLTGTGFSGILILCVEMEWKLKYTWLWKNNN
jgi:hypothetical protein